MNRAQSLALGLRFAFGGGRPGWTRTALTALGVGLGVALLLISTAIPHALGARQARLEARTLPAATAHKGDNTLLVEDKQSDFGDQTVRGLLLQPEGTRPPAPPGLHAVPAPGTMAVSPDLRKLLGSPEGRLLRDRLPYRITATIGDEGLLGPHELAYYAGDDTLARMYAAQSERSGVQRVTHFSGQVGEPTMNPVLVLLVVIMFVSLLMPVGVFVAAAVRFGGERRDRRLAALRLVGAERSDIGWIAAGETLGGTLCGLVTGAALFLAARGAARDISIAGLNVFPADLDPGPLLAAVTAVGVPLAAIAVTLFTLRAVAVEPLGVVRTAKTRPRRLWWRLLPLLGVFLLLPLLHRGNARAGFGKVQVVTGTVLILAGVVTLLPWLVEAAVRRLRGGPVGWQIAVRRLQLSPASATRPVVGVAVGVAGAIALQMLFTGIQGDYVTSAGQSATALLVDAAPYRPGTTARVEQALRAAGGVRQLTVARSLQSTWQDKHQSYPRFTYVYVGSCGQLRTLAELPACHDGDVFASSRKDFPASVPPAGTVLTVGVQENPGVDKQLTWTVPRPPKPATARSDAGHLQAPWAGLLLTPRALGSLAAARPTLHATVLLDPRSTDQVVTAAERVDPAAVDTRLAGGESVDRGFRAVRAGLDIGSTVVLLVIGASLLIGLLEQMRERRALLSALRAFGVRRSTLGCSLLWQTALPVAFGLALATGVGLGLGAVLQLMADHAVTVDWSVPARLAGLAAAVVLAVTAASLPVLWRLVRADGLRTE